MRKCAYLKIEIIGKRRRLHNLICTDKIVYHASEHSYQIYLKLPENEQQLLLRYFCKSLIIQIIIGSYIYGIIHYLFPVACNQTICSMIPGIFRQRA